MDNKFPERTPHDFWGRPAGLVRKAGKNTKPGWYYNNEFVSATLAEAKRILKEMRDKER